MQWDKEIRNTIVYKVEKQPKKEQESKDNNEGRYIMLGVTMLTMLINFSINALTACMSMSNKGVK